MFRHIAHVFLYEFRRNFRRRGYLFTTFGIPLIAFAVYFGYQVINNLNSHNASPISDIAGASQAATSASNLFKGISRAGYVDLSGRFPDAGDLKDKLTRFDDEAAAQSALSAGKIDLYYLIPADYLQTGDVTLVMPRLNLGQISADPVRRLVLGELSQG